MGRGQDGGVIKPNKRRSMLLKYAMTKETRTSADASLTIAFASSLDTLQTAGEPPFQHSLPSLLIHTHSPQQNPLKDRINNITPNRRPRPKNRRIPQLLPNLLPRLPNLTPALLLPLLRIRLHRLPRRRRGRIPTTIRLLHHRLRVLRLLVPDLLADIAVVALRNDVAAREDALRAGPLVAPHPPVWIHVLVHGDAVVALEGQVAGVGGGVFVEGSCVGEDGFLGGRRCWRGGADWEGGWGDGGLGVGWWWVGGWVRGVVCWRLRLRLRGGGISAGGGGGAGEGGFGGEEGVDCVEGRVVDDALFEEGFEFLGGSVSIYGLGDKGKGSMGWLTFLMRRRDRLVSMTRWRSSDTIVAGYSLG